MLSPPGFLFDSVGKAIKPIDYWPQHTLNHTALIVRRDRLKLVALCYVPVTTVDLLLRQLIQLKRQLPGRYITGFHLPIFQYDHGCTKNT